MPVGDCCAPGAPGGPPPGPAVKPPNDLSLPANDPNAFWGTCPDPQPVRPCFTITAEGLLGWTKNTPLGVPLVTTSTIPDLGTSFGAIGQNGTVILSGGHGLDTGTFGGARVTAGLDFQERFWWLLPMEFSIFYMTSHYQGFSGMSDAAGNGVLARPILAASVNSETVLLSAFPGVARGGIKVSGDGQLWGTEFNSVGHTGIIRFEEGELTSVKVMAGVRTTELKENLDVNSTSLIQGNSTAVVDSFQTHNQFVGPQIGVSVDWQTGSWFVNFAVKTAIGNMRERINISGNSMFLDGAGNFTSVPGGVLAVASNSGQFHRNEFAFVPEGQVTIGVELNNCLRIHLGYDIVYLSSVVRPGDHVNRTVDVRQIPTDPVFDTGVHSSPVFSFRTTDFWMQGLGVGLTFSY
jgi:hypothetical protein